MCEKEQIVEIVPIKFKRVEKAHSEILVKRYNYANKKTVVKETSFKEGMLAHQIDKSPRLRPFHF